MVVVIQNKMAAMGPNIAGLSLPLAVLPILLQHFCYTISVLIKWSESLQNMH